MCAPVRSLGCAFTRRTRASASSPLAGAVSAADDLLLSTAAQLRHPDRDQLVAGFSKLGNSGVGWVALGGLVALARRDPRPAVAVAVAVWGTLAVNYGVKQLANRERPQHEDAPQLIDAPTSSSFPSSHAAMAAAGVVFPITSVTMPAQQVADQDVAVMTDDPQAPVDASVREAMEHLVDFLERSGVQVSTQARPVNSQQAWRLYIPLVRSALAGHLSEAEWADALQRAEAGPGGPLDFPRLHWRSLTMSHREWLQLDEQRSALRQQWATFFEDWDVLIQPVAATAAFPHDQKGFRWERFIQVNGQPQPHTTQLFWAGYSGQFGLPSTAVPIGQSPEGLPIGAQLIAAPFADPVSLRLARWLETEYRGFVAPPMALN
jgi:hypothetical protein